MLFINLRNKLPFYLLAVGIAIELVIIIVLYSPRSQQLSFVGLPENSKDFFCISTHFDDKHLRGNELADQENNFVMSGAGSARYDFESQYYLTKKNGDIDLSYFDHTVDFLKGQNKMIIAVLPQWGAKDSHYGDVISSPEKYGKAALMLAEYLNKKDVRFAIEVGNEPNDEGFWPDRDPEVYTKYLKEAYYAIKSVDPNIQVITGGLVMWSSKDEKNGKYNALDWVNAMYDSGLSDLEDMLIGIHVYPGHTQPERQFEEILAIIELMRSHHNYSGVAITEFGFPTGSDGNPENVSEDEQAQLLSGFYKKITTDARLKEVVKYGCYYDLINDGSSPRIGDNYGLFSRREAKRGTSYIPKLGFGAYQEASGASLK